MITYKHGDNEYHSLYELRRAFPYVSFPATPTAEQLTKLDIEIIDLPDPEPTLDELKIVKKAEIAHERWKTETGGLTLPDIGTIATDRESQSLLNGAVTGTLLEPDKPIKWKMVDGAVELDAATVQMIGKLVRSHVQSCFNREIELIEAIDACQTAQEVVAIVWQ